MRLLKLYNYPSPTGRGARARANNKLTANRHRWLGPLVLAIVLLLSANITTAIAATHATPRGFTNSQIYIVQRGDTLWDISEQLFGNPLLWQKIWRANPEIVNPHLIYPGDQISLRKQDGKTVVSIAKRNGQQVTMAVPDDLLVPKVAKLSPRIRAVDVASEDGIATAPLKNLLKRVTVVTAGELAEAPYVMAMPGYRVLGGHQAEIYVRKYDPAVGQRFKIVRKVEQIIDEDTGEVLGAAARVKGIATVKAAGDPATFIVSEIFQEIEIGDKLVADTSNLPEFFKSEEAEVGATSKILYVFGGVDNVAKGNMVVLRGGHKEFAPGQNFVVYQRGELVRDLANEQVGAELIELPSKESGEVMVLQTFDKISIGLVTKAINYVRVNDLLSSGQIN